MNVKIITVSIALSLLFGRTSIAMAPLNPPTDLRIIALTAVGIMASTAGLYQIIKRSEKVGYALTDTLSGILLIAGGISLILSSEECIEFLERG